MLDVPEAETVSLEEPHPDIPEKTASRGRTPTRARMDEKGTTGKAVVPTVTDQDFTACCVRQGTTGGTGRHRAVIAVPTWKGEEVTARRERFVVSRKRDHSDVTYSLTHAREHRVRWEERLDQQRHRLWVEQSLKDAKREVGMDDYHVRTWRAWHHHLPLTMLA